MQRKDKVKSAGAPTAAPQPAPASSLSAEERDQRLYQAVLAYRGARYAEADAAARELRAAVADFFPAVLLGGMVAGKCGRGAEGIELLREAAALDPQSAEARSELASLLRSEGRHDAAIAAAKQALRLRPDDAGNHNVLALCYLAAGRAPLAIKELARALALKPDAPMFHHNLGLALQQQSRDFEAIAAFRRAVALDDDNTEAYAHLGQLLYQHGQPQEATQCYERAAALQPNRAVAAVQTAEALVQQGRAADAETCLRTALAADPRADLLHQVLGVLLQRLGRFAEARASLERAIELQPRRISAYASLVRGQRIGAADAPLVAAMQRLVREPTLPARDRSSLHFALGKACDDLGDYKAAIGHFDRANEIESESTREAGRWVDRRAHAAFVDQMIARFPWGRGEHATGRSPSDVPVLIVGMPRSGTTLVEQILSSHRDIGAAGELSYWTDRPVVETPVAAPDDARGRELAENYLALLRRAAPDARRVTDKMPANFLVLGLIHRVLPAARIIHCRRHPVDTCLSIYSTPVSNPLDFAHDRSNLVFYYEQYLRLMAHWRALIPADRLLEIDYERLVSEPEEVTRRLVAFCGLEWDAACLEHERSEHLIMTPSVWQARQPVYRDALERWRRYEPWLGAFRRLLPAT